MDIIQKIEARAKNSDKRIIFPESDDERVLKAAEQITRKKIARVILVGGEKRVRARTRSLGISLNGIEIANPLSSEKFDRYVSVYARKAEITENTARLIVQKPLFFAALAVAAGDADSMIAGAVHTSGDVIAVTKNVIGLQKGITVPSSFFLMNIPGYKGGEQGTLMYADASVNPNPGSEELADIAVVSGKTAERLLGWKPRIALLSFSTKGSAEHHDVCKVTDALEIARKKAPKLLIDGELQADSALVMSVARRKMKNVGKVAGKANILIFPDLDAGNIAYKLTQILAGAKAYGPILQGFAMPVSDLSRGASVQDIIGVAAILAVWSKRWMR